MPLRLATGEDAAAIAAIYAPYVRDTAVTFELDPPGPEEMGRRVAAAQSRWAWLVAVDDDGRIVGYAYTSAHHVRPAYRWSVDVTVYVASDRLRGGFGGRLYDVLLPLAAAQGYVSAYALITLPNPASVGLHERLGFVRRGIQPHVGWKVGGWHDVGIWSRDLRTPSSPPPEPVPVSALAAADRARIGL